jgi:DNA-binding cell septation regulator SpoVG
MSQIIANVTKLQNPKNGVVGIATILVGGFAINDLRVIESKDGSHLVAMPSRKSSRSQSGYKDIAHPVQASIHTETQRVVLEKFYSLA